MIVQAIRWIAAFPSMMLLTLYSCVLALVGATIEKLWPWRNIVLDVVLMELERNTKLGAAINEWVLRD